MSELKKRAAKSATFEQAKTGVAKPDVQRRNLKKSSNAALRTFIFSPTFNVVALVCLIIAVFAGVRIFSARQNHAQFRFVEQAETVAPESATAENTNYRAPEIFRGEVYDTTVRLRETGALGMAVSLAVFAEFSEKKNIPANLETVLMDVQSRKLMPPEMAFENGKLESPSSTFFIRYKSEPLAFEILSRPKQQSANSPALMLRFPLVSLDKRTITYFQSASTNRSEMPAPFAPLDRIVAAGWTIEQWRGEILQNAENASRLLEEEKRLLGNLPRNH